MEAIGSTKNQEQESKMGGVLKLLEGKHMRS